MVQISQRSAEARSPRAAKTPAQHDPQKESERRVRAHLQELLRDSAPLLEPSPVEGCLTRGDHVATRLGERLRPVSFTSGGSSHRLIQTRHSLIHSTRPNQSQP